MKWFSAMSREALEKVAAVLPQSAQFYESELGVLSNAFRAAYQTRKRHIVSAGDWWSIPRLLLEAAPAKTSLLLLRFLLPSSASRHMHIARVIAFVAANN